MNTGFLKFDCDIEMQAGIFNTSNSNLWTKLQRVFAQEIRDEYAKMRQAKFTEENLMKYLYGEQISQIPQRNYNLDMQNKYLNFGNQFLHALHGNGYSHMKRWVRERLFFLDTLLDYTVSSADYITIRANKQGSVYLDIQTYVPMYARVKWRDEANNTGTQIKKINRGETVRFNYVMPTATDQEVLVYGGRYLKDVGDLTNLQPTTLLISKAPKLTRLICTNNPNLINTDLSNCTMLQEIDLHGCTMLGGGIGSTPTLNVQKCTNLRRINIYDTQLTAIYTNTSGGNIQEINYPFTVQTVQIHNQPNLKSIGIPVHFINNGNPSNRFATSLVSVDIANCTNLTSMVKNYYEVNGEPVPVPTFLGVSSAQSFKISNSLTHLEQIDLSYCANLRSLSISDFYNLTEINFDDICAWDARYSNLSEISINNCPYVETITFNQNTIDETNSLGVAFAYGMTLDLSNLLNLKHIRSNVGVKGLQKLIVPPTVRSLVFDYPEDTRYSQQLSDIHSIWSIDAMYAHQDDGYTGIDLRGMDTITDFSMGSLASIDKADNLNIKITNTFPYFNYFRNTDFFKPTGTVDISDYTGSLAYLFKGIDMEKLDIVCDKQLTQTDAKYMFAYASCNNDETITSLFNKMQNITNLSYMFYNAYITKAPSLPLSTTDCRYMFYNCSTMTETPANWLQDYPLTPQSDYCYTGCVNIRMIDGQPDTLDSIPSAWGGFGRSNKSYSGYEIHAENTLEREIDTAIASGLTLMNVAPEYGTTPVMTNDQSSFAINEGIDSNILISEGEYETAVLKGYSLTNLAKDKGETQEFERLTEQFEMTDGLDLGVEVVDGEFVEAKFHGNTLHNIVVEDGKTSPITNVKQTFDIDNNIEEGVTVADGEYVSMTIKGNTLTNIVPQCGQTDVVEITGTVNVKDLVSSDIVTCDGEMETTIVKGRMTVNYATIEYWGGHNVQVNQENGIFSAYGSWGSFGFLVPTIVGKKYFVSVKSLDTDAHNKYIIAKENDVSGAEIAKFSAITDKYMIFTATTTTTFVGNRTTISDYNHIIDTPFISEYQEGMETWEFNYFEGIGSVVSPKIVTQNKNLFHDGILKSANKTIINGNECYIVAPGSTLLNSSFVIENFNFLSNTQYVFSFEYENPNGLTWANFRFTYTDGSETTVGGIFGNEKFVTISTANKTIKNAFISCGGNGDSCFYVKNVQIEVGTEVTSYEPYKSTTITTPSDLVLRQVSSTAYDELDLNTGTYTQRVGEFKPTANQINGHSYNESGGYYTCRVYWHNIPNIYTRGNKTVGLFNVLKEKWDYTAGGYWYSHGIDGAYYLSIPNATTLEEARQWCIDNDLTILYELKEPVIKQLELPQPYSYKDGYITTSSEQLSPILSCTIPTSNYFPTPQMESNTQYTLYFDNEVSSVNVGGNEVTSPTSPMIVTSGSQKKVKFNGEPTNVMMFKGDVRDQTINYFTGSKEIKNYILVTNGGCRFGKGGRR